jgi:hypothetical protein
LVNASSERVKSELEKTIEFGLTSINQDSLKTRLLKYYFPLSFYLMDVEKKLSGPEDKTDEFLFHETDEKVEGSDKASITIC